MATRLGRRRPHAALVVLLRPWAERDMSKQRAGSVIPHPDDHPLHDARHPLAHPMIAGVDKVPTVASQPIPSLAKQSSAHARTAFRSPYCIRTWAAFSGSVTSTSIHLGYRRSQTAIWKCQV